MLCRISRFRGPFAKYRTYAQLLARRGPRAFKKNELNADKITSTSQILDYEAIIQYTGLKDNDLLYFSYTNQARRWLVHRQCVDVNGDPVTGNDPQTLQPEVEKLEAQLLSEMCDSVRQSLQRATA